ncbi:hypothetical protein KTG14_17615 [Planococcus sp. CP5-4_YE]|uniref:hypothetical protein n=1 Tax=Planococcus sp. CP5-4_YE TaxID=2850320 RepID=UPI001C21B9F9|nr:hypothetical protein [Planococcus sp. CP5-4_YE]MBU9675197.1 hypothetical protein [Planococcus sp. CP5-4_YE]
MATREEWEAIASKRIQSILATRRISYSSHLEIKISEAGPNHLRAEPHIISNALRHMNKAKEIANYKPTNLPSGDNNPKYFVPLDFSGAADASRSRSFVEWRNLFLWASQRSEYCGFVLEKIIFDAVLETDKYHVLGSAPIYGPDGKLMKSSGSEMLTYQGNDVYKAESGAGFDLFAIHKSSHTPIGIEAKNIREWIYPASVEVWRAIARACTLECLPVIIARKISYISRGGFFANFGILGFETNFQYMAQQVQPDSKYTFKDKVIHKDKLGFADIKLLKPKDPVPSHLVMFFDDILDQQAEIYFEKFMKHKDLLKKYAIDYQMAEPGLNQGKRYRLYKEFKEEAEFEDVEFELEAKTTDFEI